MNLFEELLGREETAVGTLMRNALSILYRDLASRLSSAEDKAQLDDYTRTLVETVRLLDGNEADSDMRRSPKMRYMSNRAPIPFAAAQAPRFKYPASTAFFDWLISLGKKYNSAYDYVKRVERVFRAEAEPTTTDVLAADPERVALIIDRYAVAEGRNASTLAALNAFYRFSDSQRETGK
ncbi:MAG: hypothetical protein IJQ80_04290 [Clostridia bacterium]|nr:hypothetical protein [Clostridia bacterium]MBR0303047.1 hypothetical protein [Clostridia bacterium]